MSPFSQFRSEINPGSKIDRKFTPFFNFIDEFDRHFNHQHRSSVNPHFDLEEDETNYFLVAELPGASADDITIEAVPHNDRTITISGDVPRTLHGIFPAAKTGHATNGQANGSVEILGNGKGYIDHDIHSDAPSQEEQELPAGTGVKNTRPETRRVLLSERLTGHFNRSFAFPSSIVEESIQASVENGLLFLVVPKKVPSLKEKAKKIPVGNGKPHGFYIGPTDLGHKVVGPTVI